MKRKRKKKKVNEATINEIEEPDDEPYGASCQYSSFNELLRSAHEEPGSKSAHTLKTAAINDDNSVNKMGQIKRASTENNSNLEIDKDSANVGTNSTDDDGSDTKRLIDRLSQLSTSFKSSLSSDVLRRANSQDNEKKDLTGDNVSSDKYGHSSTDVSSSLPDISTHIPPPVNLLDSTDNSNERLTFHSDIDGVYSNTNFNSHSGYLNSVNIQDRPLNDNKERPFKYEDRSPSASRHLEPFDPRNRTTSDLEKMLGKGENLSVSEGALEILGKELNLKTPPPTPATPISGGIRSGDISPSRGSLRNNMHFTDPQVVKARLEAKLNELENQEYEETGLSQSQNLMSVIHEEEVRKSPIEKTSSSESRQQSEDIPAEDLVDDESANSRYVLNSVHNLCVVFFILT